MSETKHDMIEALNFADSFTLAMDEEIRHDGLSGSYGCFALELDNAPNVEKLQHHIVQFSQQFPTSLANLRQKGRRFYWYKQDHSPKIFFHHRHNDEQDEEDFQKQSIDQIINHKEGRETITPIEFHLISSATQHTFFMRWIHPFCDARGADLILHYLCIESEVKRQQFGLPKTEPLVSIQFAKYAWWKKVALLFKAKRYINRLDSLSSIQSFEQKEDSLKQDKKLNFSVKRLTEAQTEQVIKQAKQAVGITGTSLYYIGCLIRALEKMNPKSKGDAYCSPYAFNLRKQRVLTPMTGNHICALFAQAPRAIIQDRQQLFDHLKQQNKEVIRQQLDYAFLPLMWAGSWLPLKEYGDTLRLSSITKEERSSFWFSDVGKLDIPTHNFLGAEIKSVFHVCQVTTPPALAFLSCIYKNQLTLSYNFIEPIISTEQIDRLHNLVLEELLFSG